MTSLGMGTWQTDEVEHVDGGRSDGRLGSIDSPIHSSLGIEEVVPALCKHLASPAPGWRDASAEY